jgi:hypothetical protein
MSLDRWAAMRAMTATTPSIPLTLEELDQACPAGLRKAQMRSLIRSHHDARLTLRVRLVVDDAEAEQPRYRDAEICFHGVQYVAPEVPILASALKDCACFTYTRTERSILPEDIQQIDRLLAPEMLRYSLSIQGQLTELNIAAREVSFHWSSLTD